jgi:hypothetical protein
MIAGAREPSAGIGRKVATAAGSGTAGWQETRPDSVACEGVDLQRLPDRVATTALYRYSESLRMNKQRPWLGARGSGCINAAIPVAMRLAGVL